MKQNYLHTGKTTRKPSPRVKTALRAFGAVAAVTLAGIALAAAIGFGTTTASGRPQTGSGKNLLAEKYNTLVMRVYFRDRAERDRLAQELSAEEVPTTKGYLTVIRDRDLYYRLTARGLHVEIDENNS